MHRRCTGSCCNSVTKAVGVVMVLGSEEAGGTPFAEPAALTPEWSLKLDAPLKTPHRSNRDYLPGILAGVLKNTSKMVYILVWADLECSGLAPGSTAVWVQKNHSNGPAWGHPQSIAPTLRKQQ